MFRWVAKRILLCFLTLAAWVIGSIFISIFGALILLVVLQVDQAKAVVSFLPVFAAASSLMGLTHYFIIEFYCLAYWLYGYLTHEQKTANGAAGPFETEGKRQ